MLVFSPINDWQGDAAVKQILVFPNEEIKNYFEELLKARIAEDGIEDASDTGIGAMYKLRAVKDGQGMYTSLIRCGMKGVKLWEDVLTYKTPEEALVAASFHLRDIMFSDINTMVSEINCN